MTEFEVKFPLLEQIEFNLPVNHYEKTDWVDITEKHTQLFAERYGLHPVETKEQITSKYFIMNSLTHLELRKATTELHSMFVKATEHVLKNPSYWSNFGITEQYWQMATRSFERGDKSLCGRFDFAVSPSYGIKCYEYNADSAACLFECGYTQEAWSVAMGLGNIGVDGGLGTAKRVIGAWRALFSPGTTVHFFFDKTDQDECIHVAYVIYLAEQAGLVCKEAPNVDGFRFDDENNGLVLDNDGDVVRHIWKSWNYTTLLETLEKEGPIRRSGVVRLIDVIFHNDVSVLEPIWSAIPSNKAILPVLTELFPNSPYLLYSTFELNDTLIRNGYCSKPVLGRGGQNISIHFPSDKINDINVNVNVNVDNNNNETNNNNNNNNNQTTETIVALPGKFESSPTVYQELATLPKFDGMYTQLNTFAAFGKYAGTVIRVEDSPIVDYDSNIYSLRIVEDESKTPLPNDDLEF